MNILNFRSRQKRDEKEDKSNYTKKNEKKIDDQRYEDFLSENGLVYNGCSHSEYY